MWARMAICLIVCFLSTSCAHFDLGVPASRAQRFESLRSESDLVVIADAISSEDTLERPFHLIGQNTKFYVRTVLRGKLEGDQLTVFHYRVEANAPVVDMSMFHGFALLVFDNRTPYLLFLKKAPDGRYVPTTGQEEPMFSAYRVVFPLRTDPNEPIKLTPPMPETLPSK